MIHAARCEFVDKSSSAAPDVSAVRTSGATRLPSNSIARIILACAQGVDNSEVARGCRVMRQTVGKWRSRFLERRLDGLPL